MKEIVEFKYKFGWLKRGRMFNTYREDIEEVFGGVVETKSVRRGYEYRFRNEEATFSVRVIEGMVESVEFRGTREASIKLMGFIMGLGM